MTILTNRLPRALALAGVLAVAGASVASANIAVTQISSDPFTNTTSQHATEVEPDTFANDAGQVVSGFQVGRFFNGGASDIGWTSGDGTGAQTAGFLPGMTEQSDPANRFFERVSDASVAYDAKHGDWLISSIPLRPTTLEVPAVFVNTSPNGTDWSTPFAIPAPPVKKVDLDKNWTVCDSTPGSPNYGNCYTEFDNFGQGDLEYMRTSSDGGHTWSVPVSPAGLPKGIGGQPLVQPDGTVIVPFEALNGKIEAFSSDDGGASWGHVAVVDNVKSHGNSGALRTSPLPSAEISGDGTAYVAWQDCRFESKCSANDIVFSRSSDGQTWSTTARIPIDPVGSGVDHFIPGLGVDRGSRGSATNVALTYYFYPDAWCTPSTCVLQAGTISSSDAGAHWGNKDTVGPSMTLDEIASTSQGRMVGDYISTSFLPDHTYTTVVAIGKPKAGDTFDEGMYAPDASITVATGGAAASTKGAAPITGQGTGETHHALRDD